MGLSETDMIALSDYRTSDRFSEREKMAIEFGERVTLNPRPLPAEFLARLRAHFTDTEVAELAIGVSVFNMMNRLNGVFDLEIEGEPAPDAIYELK